MNSGVENSSERNPSLLFILRDRRETGIRLSTLIVKFPDWSRLKLIFPSSPRGLRTCGAGFTCQSAHLGRPRRGTSIYFSPSTLPGATEMKFCRRVMLDYSESRESTRCASARKMRSVMASAAAAGNVISKLERNSIPTTDETHGLGTLYLCTRDRCVFTRACPARSSSR